MMRFSVLLPVSVILSPFFLGCSAGYLFKNQHDFFVVRHRSLIALGAAGAPPATRYLEQPVDDDKIISGQDVSAYCDQAAVQDHSANETCSCNVFEDGVVELNCLENCLYCGKTDSSSCGQFSYASNLTDSNTMSYTTRFQYDGTGGRNELISVEELDCNESGECNACRVFVNGTQCNSCTVCFNGAVVDCENIVQGSSFNSCQSPPGAGLFEGFFDYDIVECAVPPPPSNDNCTSAIPIVPGSVVSGTLTGALEDIVSSCATGDTGTYGVWYSFEGTGTPVLLSTCSESTTASSESSIGLVSVYQGSGCDLLECAVGSSQSYCSGYPGGTSVLLPTEAGTTYYVYVSGWYGSFGTFDLSLTALSEQSNDACQAATDISVDGDPVVGTIQFRPSGQLGVCRSERFEPYGVAWYQFVAAQDATLRASTCGNATIGWISTVAIASGACDVLSCVEQSETNSYNNACSEGGTFVDFQVVAGTSYHVAVWGSGYGDVGLVELDIRTLNPPNNDNCETAQTVDVTANFTAAFSDVTLSSEELTLSGGFCFEQIGSPNGGGIWYSFVGTGDIVVATACSNDFSPYLTTYTGSCGSLQCKNPATWNTPKVCSTYMTGQQTAPIETEEGTVYYVLLSGSGPISGSFDFSLRIVPPVENDSCSNAIEIEANGQVIIGNTEGAIYEEFNDNCPYTSRSPGVWYSIVGDGGMLRADTCSPVTNFDTVISVYRGSCGNLQCVGANDDGCQSLSSSFTWTTEVGETYYILVSGLSDGQTGDYGLKVAPFVPASNDECDGAINLAVGGVLTGTMKGASSYNDSFACYSGSNMPTLWYYIEGTGTALKVSTCSANATLYGGVQAFEGTCSDLECVGPIFINGGFSDYDCPYPSFATWFLTEVGVRYYILLLDSSLGGENSTFTLNVTEFEIAANDVCEAALPIALTGNETVKGTTTHSLPDNVTCYEYSSDAPGVWHSVMGTGNTLSVSTCSSELNFDSSIYVFSGTCGVLECVAVGLSGYTVCAESAFGGSQASFRTEVGVEYYILVTGSYSPAIGDFALSISETVPPPNDVCSGAIEISPDTGVIVGSLSGSTSFLGSNYSCAYDQSDTSVWYSVIGTGDVLAISTCSSQLNFDSAISVSTGTCGDHVCVTSDAFNNGDCSATSYSAARITLHTEVGVKYFIAVERLNFASGSDFGLTVTTLQVPANDECSGAIMIQPDTGTISGSITNATGSYDFDATNCGNFNVPDVWYSMIGTGEVYAISTCSSVLNFDSSLSISAGSCEAQECSVYSSVGSNGCTQSSYSAARAVFRTQVGLEYFILVQSMSYASEGQFTLQFEVLEPPPNDECSGAIVLPQGDTIMRGALANATGSQGFNYSCEYSYDAPSVWFSLNGTGETYEISTCSSELTFDSALSVSSGSCDDQACILSMAYNDYDCKETTFASAKAIFRTEVGVEYFIQVQSLTLSEQGDFVLHVTTVDSPENDICTDAISITTANILGSLTNATGSLASASPCSYSYDAPDVWYTMLGTGDAYAVSTCSNMTTLGAALTVSSGTCDEQECIASAAQNENCEVGSSSAARVIFRTEPGVEYYILVQGANYETEGQFQLQISTIELPANDVCSGAVLVVPGDGPIFGSTSEATNSVTNSSCSGSDTSPDLWYRVEGTGSNITASTCGERTDYDSQLTIYEGVGEDCDTTCVVSNDDFCGVASEVQWSSTVGVTYYIRVHGFSTSSGSFVLRVT